MKSKAILNIIAVCVFVFMVPTNAQFWKLSNLSERDMFILETKATMASGICYKQTPRESMDPALRIHTTSYCCPGYEQNLKSSLMQCNPICNEDCLNGICTAPDVCECYPGYIRMGGRCEEL
ncbi:uncharacterized protein LOC119687483 [Teleopsis dalmanni]|uniref:uncharacterized protein LOC119687483 n=1 Tax=Teleopsis dalmanni TaxID=139649 RepID=UPI0018CD0C73|nr:uncharacterized protein LOC119687483 [Teleopsis dalmanni]